MKDVKIAHLGFTILLNHLMMELLDPLLTCLHLKTTSWTFFLIVSCALPYGPQLLNGLGFALFHHLRVIKCTRKPSQEDRGSFGRKSVLGLEGYRRDLPGAQKEVESIALILNTIPQ